MEGAHGVGDAASALDDEFEGALGVDVPLPGVFEGVNLGAGLRAVFFGEEDVVVLPRVEGRVEVDEVDGLVLDVALEDFVVVAVVELVFGGHGLWVSIADLVGVRGGIVGVDSRSGPRLATRTWGTRVGDPPPFSTAGCCSRAGQSDRPSFLFHKGSFVQ